MQLVESKSLATIDAPIWLAKNIGIIGKLECIEHTANPQRAEFTTLFKGQKGVVKLNGGYSSGYTGEGSRGFYDFLITMGVEPKLANIFVFTKYTDEESTNTRVLTTALFPNLNLKGKDLERIAKSFTLKEFVIPKQDTLTVRIPNGDYVFVYNTFNKEYSLETPKNGRLKLTSLILTKGWNPKYLLDKGIPKYVVEYLDKQIQNGLIYLLNRKVATLESQRSGRV